MWSLWVSGYIISVVTTTGVSCIWMTLQRWFCLGWFGWRSLLQDSGYVCVGVVWSLQELSMNGLCREESALTSASLLSIVTLALRYSVLTVIILDLVWGYYGWVDDITPCPSVVQGS